MSPNLSQLISAPTAKDYQPCAVDILSTPVGVLQLNANAYGLSHLTVVGSSRTEIPLKVASDDELARAKSHIEQAKAQLLDYFRGELTQFHLSLAPKGTEFQQQVWQALVQVGYGLWLVACGLWHDKIIDTKKPSFDGLLSSTNYLKQLVSHL